MYTKNAAEELESFMINEALESLVSKPIKSTTAERLRLHWEADKLYAGLPQPLLYGKGFCYILGNCSLPIKDTDLILGRIPERMLNEEEERFIVTVCKKNCARPMWIRDGGHRSFWWKGLLEKGLPGLRAEAEAQLNKRRAEKGITEERIIFLEGAILVYDAFLLFLERYAKEAEKAGLTEAAEVCRAITLHEPQTFRQALQLLWTVQFVYCTYAAANPTLTYGRMDLLLEDIYQKDIAEGRLTREEARLLITDYYCKNNLIMGRGEHQMSTKNVASYTGWSRNLCFDAPQYMLIGGRREDGSYLNGELTHLFAEAIVPRFKNPVIEVRYAPDMQKKCPKLWLTLVDKMRQSSSLIVYNEEDNISGNLFVGADPEDAFAFEHFGCNHPTLAGQDVLVEYGSTNLVPGLMKVLNSLSEQKREPQSTEELYGIITEEVVVAQRGIITRLADAYNRLVTAQPTMLQMTDCFYKYSIPAAASFVGCGSKYISSQIHYGSYASYVDIVAAVDELVIKRKKMTLAHLMEAVNANFEGYPSELAFCRGIPKLGSDDPIPNRHARELMLRFTESSKMLADELLPKHMPEGALSGLPVEPRPVLKNSMETDNGHLKGREMGATPDGRLAGVPWSQNCCPAEGASVNGLTARLCSMASIPFDRIVAGAQNISIQPSAFAGEEGLCKLASIIGGYFDMGGLQVQITAVDTETLKKAQEEPERYKDLMVRITGYSAVFVDMEKHAQDEIIRREEMNR